MGIEIENTEFHRSDFKKFSSRVRSNLKTLKKLLDQPGFGEGEASFGAELELYIVDGEGAPLYINQEIISKLNDPQVTLELNRYNLEYNFTPYAVADNCLHQTEAQALDAVKRLNKAAKSWQGQVVPIGILPTLQQSDIGYHAMTQQKRFEALTKGLTELRGGPFTIAIEGEEALQLAMDDVTLEGANTSFQVHLRVPPHEFADFYNAVQLVTPLALALATNSPTLLGHRLWQETRVPLFKQSIDCRPKDSLHPVPARVNFGNNWVREGAFELFAEAALLYPPILPICDDEDADAVMRAGGVPQLRDLRLHQGSVWLWNRPVFDPAGDGHLRIELRAFPAGPTVVDMVANAALVIGLAKLMQQHIRELLPAIPFTYCIANFYRAAQSGLDAELFWPSLRQSKPEYSTVPRILKSLLPKLPEQLVSMGFREEDFTPYLKVIEQRLESRQTGARWQLGKLEELRGDLHKRDALQEMFRQYCVNSAGNQPVSTWR